MERITQYIVNLYSVTQSMFIYHISSWISTVFIISTFSDNTFQYKIQINPND